MFKDPDRSRLWKAPLVRGLFAGMRLTFRAELMPGRESVERTFEVARVLANGRVELVSLLGQHALTEFEPLAA